MDRSVVVNNLRRTCYLSLFLCYFYIGNAQENYPKGSFRSPMDIPLILAGTFGELRSNHFHAGIDIKTQQRQGLPIYAIGDGSVTRIKISLWGYGKALYVAHPNGFTSVYAHLQKFSPKIEAFIKKVQYRKKSYEVEVFPQLGDLALKKGDIIAYSGNTGGSSGPHLHFEIRNSVSEKPTNPLLYGLNVRDATNPVLEKVFVYPLSKNAMVNQGNDRTEIQFKRQNNGTFLADKVHAIGDIGIGFKGFDRQDMAANKNGIYSVELSVNGMVYTEYDFETFSFMETRYINTFIDYDYFGKYRQRIQKCFKTPGNRLGIYNILRNQGKITIAEGMRYIAMLRLKDLAGNETKLLIPIEGKKQSLISEKEDLRTDTYLIAKKHNNYDLGAAKVFFPANTFYENLYLDLKKGKDTVGIHNNTTPAHRNFTITFDIGDRNTDTRKKMFIARLDKKGKPNYAKTYKRGNTFTTRTRNLGTYTLAMDTIAPKISPKNFRENQWLDNYRYLSLRISDDLSGIRDFEATLNGSWILMEYEPKKKTLTYNFDDKILNKTTCDLRVKVTDNVGNTTIYKTMFYRK